jgi:hypothetical protein
MESWQDLVLTVGSIVLIIALIPSVKGPNKPALSTSIMTGCVLSTFALVYATLNLWLSSITTIIACLLWFTLAAQKVRQQTE